MTRPRKQLISLTDTPYYHIVSRCVRRTYLCGIDSASGKSYEHRRQWIVDRIRLLSSLFAIDLCSYAVMSNHYHLVVNIDPSQITVLTDNEVISRWLCLFKGPLLIQHYTAGTPLSAAERDAVSSIVHVWRQRLGDISWFMKCLNQPIALQANKEDNCTGHFWESRFKSQALTSEEALLSCMAYVDLNPVRAAMATTPETSDYTSIQERIKPQFDLTAAIREQTKQGELLHFTHDLKPLSPFLDTITSSDRKGIPLALSAYIELVDWTGRAVLENKRGSIAATLPPILERLAITDKRWLTNATQFETIHPRQFGRARTHLVADTG